MDIYYKVVLNVIIENAQKNLLTVAKATSALLFPALRQCQHALQLFITKPLADLRYNFIKRNNLRESLIFELFFISFAFGIKRYAKINLCTIQQNKEEI
jgi:hypothetical protein